MMPSGNKQKRQEPIPRQVLVIEISVRLKFFPAVSLAWIILLLGLILVPPPSYPEYPPLYDQFIPKKRVLASK